MGTVVDIVGSEEAGVQDTTFQKTAYPVIYQLVRVDGDGRLVPATEDDVIAVENLLEDDRSKCGSPDTGRTLECSTSYGCGPCGSDNDHFIGLEGQSPLKVVEVDAEKPNTAPIPAMDSEGTDVQREKIVPNTSDGSVSQSGMRGSKTSNSPLRAGSRPDFSLLNGEIDLDSLSVKDLQETFKATFGRETSVKDKEWLKRRIIMGLTNSCDFSTTTLVIIDNRVVKKGKGQTCKTADCSVLVDCLVTSAMEIHERPTCHGRQNETRAITNVTQIESSSFQENCESKDGDTEQRPGKRVRKPTKRFIEELSEGESKDAGARTVPLIKHPANDKPSAKICARHVQDFGLDDRYLTRKDSFGGSGIQVPYVSRIRRSRPRENFMTLTAFASSERKKGIQLEKEVKLRNTEPHKTSSDDEVVTLPTANGGMKRKRHRPWTLSEVVKLVEGVAKYGAGKWSEIKRFAFTSYSYRTSVDLKDKWRNLLRASLAESPTGNGISSSRKQASVPIPAPILSRVRELANIQTQVPPSLGSENLPGFSDSNRTVHETSHGFL